VNVRDYWFKVKAV